MGAKRELRVYGGLKFKAPGQRSAIEIRDKGTWLSAPPKNDFL